MIPLSVLTMQVINTKLELINCIINISVRAAALLCSHSA